MYLLIDAAKIPIENHLSKGWEWFGSEWLFDLYWKSIGYAFLVLKIREWGKIIQIAHFYPVWGRFHSWC